MRISRIGQLAYTDKRMSLSPSNLTASSSTISNPVNTLSVDTLSFSGKSAAIGDGKAALLRELAKEEIPCLYCGRTMIDENEIIEMKQSGVFDKPAISALMAIGPYINQLHPVEKEIYELLIKKATNEPERGLTDLMKEISNIHKKGFLEEQQIIFNKLIKKSEKLPENLKEEFHRLMQLTDDKLNGTPISRPFEAETFVYRVLKASQNIDNANAYKKIEKYCNSMEQIEDENHIQRKLHIINSIERACDKNKKLDYNEIIKLCTVAKNRLNNLNTDSKFTRKAFIYDLNKILAKLPEEEGYIKLRNEMLYISEQLPSSRDSVKAFMVKYEDASPRKICLRILSPSMASIEHVKPSYIGGKDNIRNYALACACCNSRRQHTDLDTFIKQDSRRKHTIQKHINKLIEINNTGKLFKDYEINSRYIEQMAQTINTQTNGIVVPDTSGLKEVGKTRKKYENK